MFRKIVVPLDCTPLAEKVLPYINPITIPDKTEIVIVCNLADLFAVASDSVSSLPGTVEHTDKHVDLDEDGLAVEAASHLYGPIQPYLHYQCEKLHRLGYHARVQVVKDGTANKIVDVAEQVDADLIAMATHGRSDIGRWVLGSVADQVLHQARRPILLVRGDLGPPKHDRIQRILAPLDGSILSEQALPVARAIASEKEAQILLVQAVPRPDIWEDSDLPTTLHSGRLELQEQLNADERYLQRHQSNLRSASVQCNQQVLIGEPAQAIVAASQDAQSDLIIMATHARSGLDRFLHGNVAGHVLHKSTCPLLLVKGIA